MTTNVVVTAGDDYLGDRRVQLPQALNDDGTPVDISPYIDLTFSVAERVSGDLVIFKTSDYGDVSADDYIEGVASVELFGIDTISLGNGPLNYELAGTDYDGRERTLVQGRFYVTTGVVTGS